MAIQQLILKIRSFCFVLYSLFSFCMSVFLLFSYLPSVLTDCTSAMRHCNQNLPGQWPKRAMDLRASVKIDSDKLTFKVKWSACELVSYFLRPHDAL